MPKNFDEIKGYLPQLRGLIDARVEKVLYLAFQRIYEYINAKNEEISRRTTEQAKNITKETVEKTTELVNNFVTKLITNKGQGNNPLESLGIGTVTSISLTVSAIFTVSGSPVTESGTFSLTLINQSANRFFAGPTSGGAAIPTFRAIVKEDINIPFALTTSTNADPTVAEYPASTWGVHKNTTSGDVFVAYNDSGVIKKVLLT